MAWLRMAERPGTYHLCVECECGCEHRMIVSTRECEALQVALDLRLGARAAQCTTCLYSRECDTRPLLGQRCLYYAERRKGVAETVAEEVEEQIAASLGHVPKVSVWTDRPANGELAVNVTWPDADVPPERAALSQEWVKRNNQDGTWRVEARDGTFVATVGYQQAADRIVSDHQYELNRPKVTF